jgi:hypothetical protein
MALTPSEIPDLDEFRLCHQDALLTALLYGFSREANTMQIVLRYMRRYGCVMKEVNVREIADIVLRRQSPRLPKNPTGRLIMYSACQG